MSESSEKFFESSSSRLAFTAIQWQELEHQALIFKYMVSGLPIPADLLVPLKRSLDSSSFSSNLIHHQPQNVGWNYLQMGFGRKFDPELGRCRRTDGKKWRCSKEAYPDSKYCERHMHRGRNRSRKPVEIITNQTTKSTTTNNPSKSSTPTSIPISPISKNPNPSLDKDYGYGDVRSYSCSSMDDPWQMTQNVMVGSSLAHSKQRNCSVLQNQEQDQYFHFLNNDYKSEMHLKTVRGDESQRVMHHFSTNGRKTEIHGLILKANLPITSRLQPPSSQFPCPTIMMISSWGIMINELAI